MAAAKTIGADARGNIEVSDTVFTLTKPRVS